MDLKQLRELARDKNNWIKLEADRMPWVKEDEMLQILRNTLFEEMGFLGSTLSEEMGVSSMDIFGVQQCEIPGQKHWIIYTTGPVAKAKVLALYSVNIKG